MTGVQTCALPICYRFTGYSGDITNANTKTTFSVAKPVNAIANFTGAGAVTLYASPGARSIPNGPPGRVQMDIGLTDAGPGIAVGAEITAVDNFKVLTGTGTVSTAVLVPFPANLAAGQSATNTIVFNWPDTATRVQFTVHFQANGTYTGSTTLSVFRN